MLYRRAFCCRTLSSFGSTSQLPAASNASSPCSPRLLLISRSFTCPRGHTACALCSYLPRMCIRKNLAVRLDQKCGIDGVDAPLQDCQENWNSWVEVRDVASSFLHSFCAGVRLPTGFLQYVQLSAHTDGANTCRHQATTAIQ